MNLKLVTVGVVALLSSTALAAAPVPPTAPRAPAVPAPQPVKPASSCDPRASADHFPGVDVKGRPVAPADLPSGNDVQIGTEVYVEVRPSNPQLNNVGVLADLPNLGSPNCVPTPAKRGR